MSSPANSTRPALGAVKPEITLNNVVLPAPFGPMIAVTPCAAIIERHIVDRDESAEAARHVIEAQEAHAPSFPADHKRDSDARPPGA